MNTIEGRTEYFHLRTKEGSRNFHRRWERGHLRLREWWKALSDWERSYVVADKAETRTDDGPSQIHEKLLDSRELLEIFKKSSDTELCYWNIIVTIHCIREKLAPQCSSKVLLKTCCILYEDYSLNPWPSQPETHWAYARVPTIQKARTLEDLSFLLFLCPSSPPCQACMSYNT